MFPPAHRTAQQLLGRLFAEEYLAVANAANGLDDPAGRLPLVDVAQGAGLQRPPGVDRVGIHRPDQNADRLVADL